MKKRIFCPILLVNEGDHWILGYVESELAAWKVLLPNFLYQDYLLFDVRSVVVDFLEGETVEDAVPRLQHLVRFSG